MRSSEPKAGADRTAVVERIDDETFEAAVRLRIAETGLPERKARFVTAIELGALPDGDVVTVTDDGLEITADHKG
jgi:hypothetical protein